IELLKKLADFGADDSPETKLAKLRQFLVVNDAGKEGFPLLASLLSLPLPAVAELNLSPHRQKQKTLEAITALFLGMTREKPVVLVIDDLHWIDPSTLELVSALIDEGPSAGVLLVLTARNEFSSPWGARGHISQINLSRLSKKRIEALATHIAGDKPLPDEVMKELVAKTDGVPLFVEELTKNVLEQSFIEDRGSHWALKKPLPPLGIPGTLRDSLTSRLDRLGSAKTTAQLAATLGREFEYGILRSVSALTDQELERDLKALVEGELLYQRGTPPRAKYSFKHSLVQETAYESLLKNARRQAHSRIASVLAESQPELCQTQPEVLAHHRAAAGQHEQAAGCLLQAGQLALQRSANVEAIAHFNRAIELCEAMPESGDRSRLESTLHTILGVPLMMTKGYGAAEVEKTYAKALSLTSGGEAGQMLPVLWGLWIFYHVRANYRTAYEVSEKLLALAEGTKDQTVHVCAHLAHGSTSMLTGKLDAARTHLERTIELYDPVQHRSHAYLFGQDSLAFAQAMLAWDLWLLGYPDQAVRVADESIRWAREIMHPHSLAFAQGLTGALHQYRGDRPTAAAVSSELIAMAGEQGLLHWLSAGRIVHGWATSGPTTDNEGIPEMEEGRAVWRAIGARVADTHWDAMIAERLIDMGRIEDGMALVAAMKAFVVDSDEHSFEPEISRIEGELLLAQPGKEAEAEACLERAIDEARKAGSRALLLRAATSLARRFVSAGRTEAAQNVLGPIWATFKEGQQTRDLVRAKAALTGVFL
ncbi:MAG: AAA family ATPase, partial [Myxococcales bacterium]|nr:AAA family ATPase [Myxococcales bacterium]